jgi:hypothetical protein
VVLSDSPADDVLEGTEDVEDKLTDEDEDST